MLKVPEIKISFIPKMKITQLPMVTDSRQAFNVLIDNWDQGSLQFIEQFKILLLNKGNRVLGIYNASTGGMTNTLIDPRVVFIAALKACATAIILAHNHPSGNLRPSNDDIILTRRIKDAGKLLDIAVLDHIVITADGYTSLNEEGYL